MFHFYFFFPTRNDKFYSNTFPAYKKLHLAASPRCVAIKKCRIPAILDVVTTSSSPWHGDSSHQAQTTRFTKIKTVAKPWKFTLHMDFKGNIQSQILGWGILDFEPQPARSPPEGTVHAVGVYAGFVTKFGLNMDGELCSCTWIGEKLILAQQL